MKEGRKERRKGWREGGRKEGPCRDERHAVEFPVSAEEHLRKRMLLERTYP
jgi:hypothetical protein